MGPAAVQFRSPRSSRNGCHWSRPGWWCSSPVAELTGRALTDGAVAAGHPSGAHAQWRDRSHRRQEKRLSTLRTGRLQQQMSDLPPFEGVFREVMRVLREADLPE